jgi:hypothetical protein
MKRRLILSALAGLGMFCADLKAAPPDTLALIRLEGRVNNLELLQENLDAHVELKKQELDAAVYRTNIFIWIGIGISVFGIIGGIGAIWFTRKKALAAAEELIAEEVKRRIPQATQRKIQELVALLSTYDMESILAWAKSQLRDQRVKQEAKIAVWVESKDDLEVAQNEVKGWGFRNVKAYLPSEDLPEADLVLFYRKGNGPDGGWKQLNDSSIKRMLDKYREDKTSIFFYYGPYNPALDPKMHPRFGLANMPLTAEGLMVRLLGQHMTFEDE